MLAFLGYNAIMLDARQIAEIARRQDGDPEASVSMLHYYVQVGILPPALGRGRNSYTPEHLTRFRLARRLKRDGAGLAEIRERLGRLTPDQVAAELARRAAQSLGAAASLAGPYAVRAPRPLAVHEPPATPVSLAAEALRARSGAAPRTLRFRGGFSLQVPAGTTDDRIARLYAAIEAVLNDTDPATQDTDPAIQEEAP